MAQRYEETVGGALYAGVDAGHQKKLQQLKEGFDDALRRIEINCNNHYKQKYSAEIQKAHDQMKAPIPKIGESLNLSRYKVGGALANVLSRILIGIGQLLLAY